MSVNKTEFIDKLAKKGNMQKVTAAEKLDLFLETLIDCLKEDGTVKLYGFGKFEVKTTKERIGRNPKNGKEYMIPEQKKIKFHASDTLIRKIEE